MKHPYAAIKSSVTSFILPCKHRGYIYYSAAFTRQRQVNFFLGNIILLEDKATLWCLVILTYKPIAEPTINSRPVIRFFFRNFWMTTDPATLANAVQAHFTCNKLPVLK